MSILLVPLNSTPEAKILMPQGLALGHGLDLVAVVGGRWTLCGQCPSALREELGFRGFDPR